MIPSYGCDPNINIIKIGAEILNILANREWKTEELLERCSETLVVSVDHIILTLDWLFMISAIQVSNTEGSNNVSR
jgi:hypothetical protein